MSPITYEDIKNQVLSLEKDARLWHEKGNKAAGTRLRKGLQDLKVIAQDYRLQIQETKNAK